MSNVKVKPFSTRAARLTPLAAAVSLALYGAAYAATVTPNQLPGKGNVVNTQTLPPAGVAGSAFNDVPGSASIDMNDGNTVIQWGLGTDLNAAGIGGFYTPTGVGTQVAEGREVRTFDGREYLLERPIRGDFALIKAWKADALGNLVFRKTARNFNGCMAGAASVTIAEVEEIVPIGGIDPDAVHVPSIYVQRLVLGTGYRKPIERRTVRQRS